MSSPKVNEAENRTLDDIYEESHTWHLNTGDQVIHAKRMSGRFRTLKWITSSVWLIFFLGPYLRWHGHQAVLFDIPARQFHIFSITILPQDVWMLSLVLLFFAILLAVVTSVAGRVFCGFFCFQTVWTDVFTWIEGKLEGPPQKRFKLDKAPWTFAKFRTKITKWAIWLVIAMLTGLSFAAWFTDAYQLWISYFTLSAPAVAWIVLGMFTAGTFVLAGFMREQACFWLCPYARIQSVMYDKETVLPTYDFRRGEPRGKLKKGEDHSDQGDCIDCGQCVAVCPTGIDIRNGSQEGCITCALCIDACDAIMDKIKKPHGLIRYASLDELEGKPTVPIFKRPRVLVYSVIILTALSGITYGLTHLSGISMLVFHQRLPLFVKMSDGSVQNRYTIKLLNKTNKPLSIKLTATGPKDLRLVGADKPLQTSPGHETAYTVFIRVKPTNITAGSMPVQFHAVAVENKTLKTTYTGAAFISK